MVLSQTQDYCFLTGYWIYIEGNNGARLQQEFNADRQSPMSYRLNQPVNR